MKRALAAIDAFLFAPRDLRVFGAMRIAFATVVMINALFWAPDLELWFGERGVLPYAEAVRATDPGVWTLLGLYPQSDSWLWGCYFVFVAQIALLGLGLFSRVQALGVAVWLISFQHRNPNIMDGEDTVFRMLAFLLVLLPIGACYSLDAWRARVAGRPLPTVGEAWAVRLVQLEMTSIYLSTALLKARGDVWTNGTALYYVSRLDDLWGRFPYPHFLFDSLPLIRAQTWTVLAIEVALPFLLWIPRTRRLGVVLGVLLHLGIDYLMNLFMFEWVMIVGLMAFTVPADYAALANGVGWLRRKLFGAAPVPAASAQAP